MSDIINADDLRIGAVVYLDGNRLVRLDPKDGRTRAIGIAKRDIAKGEIVQYSPNRDTEDIAIRREIDESLN